MSTWIIDGNNLLHRDPRLRAILQQSGFDAARRFLEAELGRRRGGGDRFHVVYDGGEGGRGGSGVAVSVARRGSTADDEILRIARAGKGNTPVRVVTSDRHDIGTRLAGLAVEWVSTEAFRSVLWGPSRSTGAQGTKPDEDGTEEKPQAPRGREVDRWLEEFGEGSTDGDD